jgi:hypothetical protein
MRVEQAQAKKGWHDGLVGALMDLALITGAVLSMGSAPTKQATFSIEAAKPEAVEFASITPGEEIAEKNTLDLQLD